MITSGTKTGSRGEMSPNEKALRYIRENGFVPINGHNQYYCDKNGTIIGKRGKVITGHIDRCGYRNVLLTENYITKNYLAHRLILSTFLPIEGWNDMQVNHINGDKADNRLENLEWCTRSENIKHAYDTGLEKKYSGTNHWAHKLSQEAVDDIRENAITGHRRDNNVREFAEKYNCDISIVRDVIARRSYNEN